MTLWDGPARPGRPPGEVTFRVVGVPVQQGSMRAFVHNGHAVLKHDRGKSLTDWRLAIGQAAAATGAARVVDAPVSVDAVFILQRPRAHFGARGLLPSAPRVPTTTPDLDKLARALLDALTGVLFTDDRQVWDLAVQKVYAVDDEAAGVQVTVTPLLP